MRIVALEVCCGSAADALAAWEGGAKRVELNSDLFHGGLTATAGALRVVKAAAPELQVMCMVRPREGGFCYTDTEYAVMLEDARVLLDSGADGIVFGFLHPDGTVDAERCREMLALIGRRQSVFHRAIDVVPDPIAALDTLIALGVDRVLTSGQRPTVPEGLETIRAMLAHAAGRIEILPGGGITPENAAWVSGELGVDTVHAAIHRTAYDRSAMGNPSIYFGGAVYPPEDRYALTHPADVAAFLSRLEG